LSLDDPLAKYVIELQRGRDIRKVTLGQLASFTSGLVLPQDHPPWPKKTYTQAGYLRYLQRWTLKKGHSPGKQVIHAQSSFVLLRLALERRFGAHYADLMERRLLGPLGLATTALPMAGDAPSYPRGRLPSALVSRAVQGYAEDGTPTGVPGDLQGYYHWRGAGQMYSSARDMAVFLAVHLGDRSDYTALQEATKLSQRGVLPFPERSVAALAWERHQQDGFEIVDRYGGLNNATAIAAMIPARQLGIVILCNRGNQDVATAAHAILTELADR
jgi:beta-lactamase class C